MRSALIKIVAFLAAFMCIQGILVPWIISNSFMPLWADIALLSLIMMAVGVAAGALAANIIGGFKS